jgi:hypothetical protein
VLAHLALLKDEKRKREWVQKIHIKYVSTTYLLYSKKQRWNLSHGRITFACRGGGRKLQAKVNTSSYDHPTKLDRQSNWKSQAASLNTLRKQQPTLKRSHQGD